MGNSQSNTRTTNYKKFRITGREIKDNYVRFHLDDYVTYKNGNYKQIDFKSTFFSLPVMGHYYTGDYVKIDLNETRYKGGKDDFDFFSDVIKGLNREEILRESSSNIMEAANEVLGGIAGEINDSRTMYAAIVQETRAFNQVSQRQTSWNMPPKW